MTCGEIYKKNKSVYDKEALKWIKVGLEMTGDICHPPFEMKTYGTRYVCEKVTDNIFLGYQATVKEIIYDEYGAIESYNGDRNKVNVYSFNGIVEKFGFRISDNPNSESNRKINNYN